MPSRPRCFLLRLERSLSLSLTTLSSVILPLPLLLPLAATFPRVAPVLAICFLAFFSLLASFTCALFPLSGLGLGRSGLESCRRLSFRRESKCSRTSAGEEEEVSALGTRRELKTSCAAEVLLLGGRRALLEDARGELLPRMLSILDEQYLGEYHG